MDLEVADVVGHDFLSVHPDCPVRDAIQEMHKHRSSSVLVVEHEEPIGIFTERDSVGLLLESFDGTSWQDLPVRHVMTSPVIAVCEDCTVMEALAIARGGKIRHMPVIDLQGKIAGVLTQGDLLACLFNYCQKYLA